MHAFSLNLMSFVTQSCGNIADSAIVVRHKTQFSNQQTMAVRAAADTDAALHHRADAADAAPPVPCVVCLDDLERAAFCCRNAHAICSPCLVRLVATLSKHDNPDANAKSGTVPCCGEACGEAVPAPALFAALAVNRGGLHKANLPCQIFLVTQSNLACAFGVCTRKICGELRDFFLMSAKRSYDAAGDEAEENELESPSLLLLLLLIYPRLLSARQCFKARLDIRHEFADPALAMDHFRFTIPEMETICTALKLPPRMQLGPRNYINSFDCLAILLNRLATGANENELSFKYQRHRSNISLAIHVMLDFVCRTYKQHIICNVELLRRNAPLYCEAIKGQGAHLECCIGFIDGTNREACRPTIYQDLYYSGHKHYHSYKFQSFVTPNGLISGLEGPVEGKRHDQLLYDQSKIRQILADDEVLSKYCLFADQGYRTFGNLASPHRTRSSTQLNDIQREFNRSMLKPRLTVEWMFMRVTQLFSYFHDQSKQRMHGTAVGSHYSAAVFFVNVMTCMRGGNIVSACFNCPPPTLAEYLADAS